MKFSILHSNVAIFNCDVAVVNLEKLLVILIMSRADDKLPEKVFQVSMRFVNVYTHMNVNGFETSPGCMNSLYFRKFPGNPINKCRNIGTTLHLHWFRKHLCNAECRKPKSNIYIRNNLHDPCIQQH